MRRLVWVLVLTLISGGFSLAANAQSPQQDKLNTQYPAQTILEKRAADAVAVFGGAMEMSEVFDKAFITAVPPAQFQALNSQLTAQFGKLLRVESVEPSNETSAAVVFRFEKALGQATMVIDPAPPNKITGLRITSFEALNDDLAKVRAELAALPGEVGVLFTRLDEGAKPILAVNEDRQFAIGSTFKLYLLSALARSIENGERSWSDVLTIDRKSFPSGVLQNWPAGAPVTIQTLATQMISISDNTATDILFHELGRDKIEAEIRKIGHSDPSRTLPFLSTLEMFALKGSEGNLAKYVAADEAGKRFILADFEDDIRGNRNLVSPPRFVDPLHIDTVEWFASARDLQKLAKRLSDIRDPTVLELLSVNKALPRDVANDWGYVGYKGGSEPGVLNLTWLLRDEADRWHVLTLSWNNTEDTLDNTKLELLAQRILPFAF